MRWVVLVGLVACGDNFVDEPAASHGGDRLELYWYELDGTRELASRGYLIPNDGASAVMRMFDTARDEDCELVEWADGLRRCTPGVRRGAPFQDVEAFPIAVFADAACREVRGLANGQVDYFLYGNWVADQFLTSLVVHSGPPADEQGSYYELRDGACAGPQPTDEKFLWTVTDSIQGDALVAFSPVELSTTSDVGHQVLVGEDGAQLHSGFYDRARSARCSLVYGEADLRCMPSETTVVGRTFADTTCTQPAVADAARFAYEQSEITGCVTAYELGEVRRMEVFELEGAACVPAGIGDYRTSSPISLPVVDVSLEGSGRIVDVLLAGAPISVFDTVRNTKCSSLVPFGSFSEGISRCMPELWAMETVATGQRGYQNH
ncbi:MAG: hypothetical protein H0V17_12800, partial [Deltaproteobacteria bacterium]|nr:hypothetical protein [Deltaproteobacteria bacterium]